MSVLKVSELQDPDNGNTALTIDTDGAVTINESGADVDFRIESDTDANAFFLDGATGDVSIGQNLKFNSGYGSAATAYGCRAWVNFNGTGTVAIRESGNVSSITDNGTGDYTVNFTTAMPDANYAAQLTTGGASNQSSVTGEGSGTLRSTTAIRVYALNTGGGFIDSAYYSVAIFR